MTGALSHRGPDDRGHWLNAAAGVGLAHCRLAVIDLSAQGHQPMASPSGRYMIVFNGEIYNHRELRRELEASGCRFRGHSDTEVLLAAVEAWGARLAVERSTGQFAYALWDGREQELSLVRDRMGEKPLYYGTAGTALVFGSELKALRMHPRWRAEIDRDAVTLLLRYGNIPAPYSIYRGVYKLLPGSIARVKMAHASPLPGHGPLPCERYWSVEEAVAAGRADPFVGTDAEAADELERLLAAAIRRQMVVDVEVGAFLSGGIDSSVVVALMQANSGARVNTFTIGFHERRYDEAGFARAVATHLDTHHRELYVAPADAMAIIPRLPVVYDEPFSDSSQIATLLISELTRRSVTVSLSGDGGDEVFGGYDRYRLTRSIWNRSRSLPVPIRQAGSAALRALGAAQWDRVLRLPRSLAPQPIRSWLYGEKVIKLGDMLAASTVETAYMALLSHWRNPESVVLGAREPASVLANGFDGTPPSGVIERLMLLDQLSYLPDHMLVKLDRASMAVALESRVPLLDHHVVEFAWRLPASMKVRRGTNKWLLRQVLYKHVPRQLFQRPKRGFSVPIDDWLRGPLREWASDLLSEDRLRREGYLRPSAVRHAWEEHLAGRRNAHYALWNILMFEAWLAEWESVTGGRNKSD